MIYKSIPIALTFVVKLLFLKSLLDIFGTLPTRDIIVFSFAIQFIYIFQFGGIAKAKTLLLSSIISDAQLKDLYISFNYIFLSIALFLSFFFFYLNPLNIDNLYDKFPQILLGLLYGFFIMQNQILTMRQEALSKNNYIYFFIFLMNLIIVSSIYIFKNINHISLLLFFLNLIIFVFLHIGAKIRNPFGSISGIQFFKIEFVSIFISTLELPLISAIVSPEELIVYLILLRFLYAPVLLYGQVSRPLWSAGMRVKFSNLKKTNPEKTNLLFAVLSISALIFINLFLDNILGFFDKDLDYGNKVLILLFSAWSFTQIINRHYKNKFLGENIHEFQADFFLYLGLIYIFCLFILSFVSPSLAYFISLKLIYVFIILIYNYYFMKHHHRNLT